MRFFRNTQLSAAVYMIVLVCLGFTATAAVADAVLSKAGEARAAVVGDIVRLPPGVEDIQLDGDILAPAGTGIRDWRVTGNGVATLVAGAERFGVLGLGHIPTSDEDKWRAEPHGRLRLDTKALDASPEKFLGRLYIVDVRLRDDATDAPDAKAGDGGPASLMVTGQAVWITNRPPLEAVGRQGRAVLLVEVKAGDERPWRLHAHKLVQEVECGRDGVLTCAVGDLFFVPRIERRSFRSWSEVTGDALRTLHDGVHGGILVLAVRPGEGVITQYCRHSGARIIREPDDPTDQQTTHRVIIAE